VTSVKVKGKEKKKRNMGCVVGISEFRACPHLLLPSLSPLFLANFSVGFQLKGNKLIHLDSPI